MENTVKMSMQPGNTTTHHSPENKKLAPERIKVPKEGVEVGTPAPRKLRVASSIIATPKPTVAITMLERMMLGKMWRHNINQGDAPMALAAST